MSFASGGFSQSDVSRAAVAFVVNLRLEGPRLNCCEFIKESNRFRFAPSPDLVKPPMLCFQTSRESLFLLSTEASP